ncbi:MFS transporter [Streptomyces sp. NPDC050529]|uniref:MFS transporter n=1 Tax=Streptomyces sp. NPDC050529 TaxID=3365624 RepID=UPI003793C11F
MSEDSSFDHACTRSGANGSRVDSTATDPFQDPRSCRPEVPGLPSRGLLTLVLSVHHLLVSLGLYTVMPVLAVVLSRQATGAAGPGLFCYTASAGSGSLLISRWLSRRRYLPTMIVGTLLAATGFGLLPYADGGVVPLGLLLTAGFGMSLHSLLSRVLVAEMVTDDIGRQRLYSTLMIAINIAASIGPFLAMATFPEGDSRPLFTVVAGCYLLAGASLAFGVRPGLRTPVSSTRWPISRTTLRITLRDSTARATVLATLVGTFLYAQLSSSVVLLLAEEFTSASMRAVLLAAPAVGIVVLQTPATAVMARLMGRGVPPFVFVCAAALGFSGAMLVLGSGLSPAPAVVTAIFLFTLAEPFFHSTVSTAFAGLPADSRLEAFNLRQVCWTTGEALGALCGGALFLVLYRTGHGHIYWLVLGAGAMITITPLTTGFRKRSHRKAPGATGTKPAD